MTFSLFLYRLTTHALTPFAPAFLKSRLKKGKEDGGRLEERLGFARFPRPQGPVIWIHGASVGESLSLLPLVEILAGQGFYSVVTTGTVTSAKIVARRLPAHSCHHYIPLDMPRFMNRFLDHWRPDLVLFAESELWPNAMMALKKRHIPLVLVNGRLSPRSFRRWSRFSKTAQKLLSCVSLALMQASGDAGRLLKLKPDLPVQVTGNLKFDVPALNCNVQELAHVTGQLSSRPVWLAASTHPGEEAMVVETHKALKSRYPDLLTIIAPRHPHRGQEIIDLAWQKGIKGVLRSEGHEPDGSQELYIANSMGELGLFYRLSAFVFVGGSLVPHGGQNPIEPSKLGAALIHGPYIDNFTDIYAAIDAKGGAWPVTDQETLTEVVQSLFANPGHVREMSRAAHNAVEGLKGALNATLAALEPLLSSIKR